MELGPAIALAGGEADQCKVGRGVAIQRRWRGSEHRAAPQLLSARTVAKAKVQTAHCKLTTLLLVLLLNLGERTCCHGFHYLSSVQRLESQWGKSNGFDPFTPFNMYLEKWKTGFEV